MYIHKYVSYNAQSAFVIQIKQGKINKKKNYKKYSNNFTTNLHIAAIRSDQLQRGPDNTKSYSSFPAAGAAVSTKNVDN